MVLTDNEDIRSVGRRHLDSDEVTDVISYTFHALPGEAGGATGEVIVNVERAVDEGERLASSRAHADWSPSKELALYIAHGCDHLSGASDATLPAHRSMRRRELGWLREAGRLGLTENLLAD